MSETDEGEHIAGIHRTTEHYLAGLVMGLLAKHQSEGASATKEYTLDWNDGGDEPVCWLIFKESGLRYKITVSYDGIGERDTDEDPADGR